MNRNKIVITTRKQQLQQQQQQQQQQSLTTKNHNSNSFLLVLLLLLVGLSIGFFAIYGFNKTVLLNNITGAYDNLIIENITSSNNHEVKSPDFSLSSLRSSLTYPPGMYFQENKSPPNMPSILVKERKDTTIYGGKIDKQHLGGFTNYDEQGVSNNTFNFIVGILGVKSVLDVGCGRGISTSYFLEQGVKVLCVEGSHDAVLSSFLPADKIVEHDFTRGPWWPEQTFDACWCVEFLEHVSRHYINNYMASFHKCALIFTTRSEWGGYHHVEVRPEWWWISRFHSQSFIYDASLTAATKLQAWNERFTYQERSGKLNAIGQHIQRNMMVFINPLVASLPRHKHLFSGNGCYSGNNNNEDGGVACNGADALPDDYKPLLNCIKKEGIDPQRKFEEKIWICEKNLPNSMKRI